MNPHAGLAGGPRPLDLERRLDRHEPADRRARVDQLGSGHELPQAQEVVHREPEGHRVPQLEPEPAPRQPESREDSRHLPEPPDLHPRPLRPLHDLPHVRDPGAPPRGGEVVIVRRRHVEVVPVGREDVPGRPRRYLVVPAVRLRPAREPAPDHPRRDDEGVQARAGHLGPGATQPEAVLLQRELPLERVVLVVQGFIPGNGVVRVVHALVPQSPS